MLYDSTYLKPKDRQNSSTVKEIRTKVAWGRRWWGMAGTRPRELPAVIEPFIP